MARRNLFCPCDILFFQMSITIRDPQGNILGTQDDDGVLRDRNNKRVGHITNDGFVYDSERVQVGTVNARGDVLDRYGRQMGSMDAEGTVYDWHGIPVYYGSVAPLLIDFENKEQDPMPDKFKFDEMARQAPDSKTPRGPISFLPDGFVSPSVIGCFGIAAAVVVGFIIMFVLQNPSMLSPGSRTPTSNALVRETPAETTNPEATTEPDAQATEVPQIQEATGQVNTQILNLREGPATTFEIVDRLQLNTEVVMVGRLEDGSWLRVNVPSINKAGWVATEYITTEANTNALPVVPAPSQ